MTEFQPPTMASDFPRTLPALLLQRAASTPEAPAQWSLDAGGHEWCSRNWRGLLELTARVATSLSELGLSAGDRLGILSPTRAEWDVVQMAALAVGAVVVGIDVHEHDARLAQVLEISELSALAVSDEALLSRLPTSTRDRLRIIITFAPQATLPGVTGWTQLRTGSAPESFQNHASPEAPALIVFTSGTTGAPKAIAYTHRQVTLACDAIIGAFPNIGSGARLACWLPLSNLFQRMINFCAIARGAQTFYVENPRDIMAHLPRIAPHVFIAVPRFYEKFYAGLRDRVAAGPAWQRRVFALALHAASRVEALEREGKHAPWGLRMLHAALGRLALRPARAAMGGHLQALVSGSAPMPKWLLEHMAALGLPVYEAYGMSENIVPICMNRPGAVRFGTVGKPLQTNAVRIAEDGELLVRGPGVFTGYLGEAPAQRDAEGYLPTGDFAEQDAEGFITLTGRKSEIFKTSTGRRIAPNGIESLIKQLPYIEQCMVLGSNRPFVIAIAWISAEQWALAPDVVGDMRQRVSGLPEYQQPAGVVVTTRMPSLERGEITPNLKMRRREVERNYAADVDRLYAQLQHQGSQLVVAQA